MAKIAVIGSHNQARLLLENLFMRGYDKNIDVFSSPVSGGAEISFGEYTLPVKDINDAVPTDYDLAVFVDNEALATGHMRKWVKAKTKVINAILESQDGVLNQSAMITQPLLTALYALPSHKIESVRLTAFIGADIAGQDGMSELYNHTRRILMNEAPSGKQIFPKTLAFNIIPQVGTFIGEETETEWLFNSGIKQFVDPDIKVHANCALVPIFVGMGAFVSITTRDETEPEDIIAEFKKAPKVLVVDNQKDGGYACPTDAQGENNVFISRIRQDLTSANSFSFWLCGDYANIAAFNLSELVIKTLKKEKK